MDSPIAPRRRKGAEVASALTEFGASLPPPPNTAGTRSMALQISGGRRRMHGGSNTVILEPWSIETYRDISLGRVLRSRRLNGASVVESAYAPGFAQPVHRHERACLTLVLKGGVREQSGGYDCEYLPGDILRKPAGIPHSDRFAPTTTMTLTLDFAESGSASDGARLLDELGYGIERRREARIAMFAIWRATRTDSNRFDLGGLFADLCATLDRRSSDAAPVRSKGAPPAWLCDIRACIWDRSSERIRVRELAAQAGVHPVYLARVFRRHFGVSVTDYISAVRLARSIELMAGKDRRLIAVAAESGFADQPHWCRAFRSRTGLTPRAFRTMLSETLR